MMPQACFDRLSMTGCFDQLSMTECFDQLSMTGCFDKLSMTGCFDQLSMTGCFDQLSMTGCFDKLSMTLNATHEETAPSVMLSLSKHGRTGMRDADLTVMLSLSKQQVAVAL
jgi:hypothetical protein